MLHWYAQEHRFSCVAACLRMVLGGMGRVCTEAQVRQLLGNPWFGITLPAAQAQLIKAGARAIWHDDWNLDDLRDALRQGLYPIVGVERHSLGYPPASHAIVPISISSRRITVLDPLDGPHPRQYKLQTFDMAWDIGGKETLVMVVPPNI